MVVSGCGRGCLCVWIWTGVPRQTCEQPTRTRVPEYPARGLGPGAARLWAGLLSVSACVCARRV